MTQAEAIAQLVTQALNTTHVITDQQAILFALLDYFREQPSFDRARFAELHARRKEGRKVGPSEDLNERLLALLRDFEGPIQ